MRHNVRTMKKQMDEATLELLANEIEAQYAHLSDEEWYKVVKILSQRADV